MLYADNGKRGVSIIFTLCTIPASAVFPSLQVVKYISRYFHSYEFVANLHIFPMKNVTFRTFLAFVILQGERLTNLLTTVICCLKQDCQLKHVNGWEKE